MSKHLHHAARGFSFTPIPAEPLSSSQQESLAYDVQQSTAYAPGFNPSHKQRNSSTPNTTTNIPPVQISTETFKSESVDLSPDAVRSLLADFEPINLTGIQDSPPCPPTNPSVPPVTNPYVKKVTNPYVTKVTNNPYVKVTHPLDAFFLSPEDEKKISANDRAVPSVPVPRRHLPLPTIVPNLPEVASLHDTTSTSAGAPSTSSTTYFGASRSTIDLVSLPDPLCICVNREETRGDRLGEVCEYIIIDGNQCGVGTSKPSTPEAVTTLVAIRNGGGDGQSDGLCAQDGQECRNEQDNQDDLQDNLQDKQEGDKQDEQEDNEEDSQDGTEPEGSKRKWTQEKFETEEVCPHCFFPLSICCDKEYGKYCITACVETFDFDYNHLPTKRDLKFQFEMAYSRPVHFKSFVVTGMYDKVVTHHPMPDCMKKGSFKKCLQLWRNAKELQSYRDSISDSVVLGYEMKTRLRQLFVDSQNRKVVKIRKIIDGPSREGLHRTL